MFARLWTALILALAGFSAAAWIVALMHERDIRPVRDVVNFFKRQPKSGRVLFSVFFIALWIFASTKPGGGGNGGGDGGGGDGGTNNVPQMMPGPGVGNLQPMNLPGGEIQGLQGQAQFNPDLHPVNQPLGGGATLNLSGFEPITSTNTTHTIEAADFERGFVMTRIGTNEGFDFTPPSNATTVNDWRAFGAATDWIYATFTNWTFKVATNDVSRLRIYSFGKVDPLIREVNISPEQSEHCEAMSLEGCAIATNYWFAPFVASLGIVPQANWNLLDESDRPSQVWYVITPEGSLLITWQNALLDRDTGKPISFQIEFKTDGQFIYRYDLSRLDVDSVTNILAGASFISPERSEHCEAMSLEGRGNEWTTNALPTNVTSMAFYPLSENDAYDQDPDNDGLLTIDELFFYNTDPHNADTDYDGLNDGEELLVYNTNPLDPYSIGSDYSDGLAVRLGDLDPFSFPEGSTNTVLEHIFYTGTTNGVFAYPQSSESMAVLQVSVSGFGTGDLIVGSQVVPLVAPPQLRSAPPNPMPPLLVQLVKGETYPVYFRGDELLEVSLNSADFAFGVLPTYNTFGRINFPNTVATTPCIHDFNARRKGVNLPTSRDAHLLTCTWQGSSNVEVENDPPRSATITGNFSARTTSGITYTLSHPQYLFGQTSYDQTVRFCPQPPDLDPEDPDPPWYSNGDGDASDGNDDDHDEHWCCFWGMCDGSCSCGCNCVSASGDPLPGEEDLDEECPEHSMPYENCAYLHECDYTNAVQNVQHLGGVLYIRDPPLYEQIHLDVPTEHVNCCPCPDHWTNYVGVAYKSYRLRLIDSNGMNFSKTETSCDVNLAGVYPSSAVGDATLAFSRNGEIYQQHDKTVLGVAIKGGYGVDLAAYNALNSSFGYPMTVCTNLWDAPSVRLVTNVKLPDGKVHLELANATGQFTFWYYDHRTWEYRKLLDTDTATVKDISMAYWKALMKRAAYEGTSELPIYITSSTPGHVSLIFRYWNVIEGKFVQDQAVQRITSLHPPLLADMNGDGAFGDDDVSRCLDGRLFRFWMNEDCHKGDYIGQISDTVTNTVDMVMNGCLDLVNLFPAKIDLKPFIDAWGSAATFHLSGPNGGFRFCRPDVSTEAAWAYQTNDLYTTTGQPVSSATLTAVSEEGIGIEPVSCLGTDNAPGVLAFEAAREICSYDSLELQVKIGGEMLFRYRTPWSLSSVKAMYRWRNIRSVCGDIRGENNSYYVPWNNPDEECDGRHFVFVHGYNVSPDAAREWADAMFKRLWLSGSRSMFTAVDWYGDSSQFATLFHGDVSPDYYANVVHAFSSASNFVAVVDALPGTNKVMLAHSLGNMLVSSAAVDHHLQYSRYYMLNAAVPMEAYDETSFSSNMVDSAWSNVPTPYRASDWSSLFVTNDFRSSLSWCGRFAGIQNAVNCYSETEDVLTSPTPHGLGGAWSKQELFKGTTVWHALNAVPFLGLDVACEGGWGINAMYAVNPMYYLPVVGFYTSVSNLSREAVIEHPLFTPFSAESEAMHSTNLFTISNSDYRAQLRSKFLGDAIPATSFSAGANSVSTNVVCGNINYRNCQSVEWPRVELEWWHSDIKNVAYRFNWKLFRCIISNDKGDNNEEPQQNGE